MAPEKSNPSDKPETPLDSHIVENTAGNNTRGSKIDGRELENYIEEQSNLQQRREERGTLGNSEGSGQQYSNTEQDVPPGQDEDDQISTRNKKDDAPEDDTSDTTEGSE